MINPLDDLVSKDKSSKSLTEQNVETIRHNDAMKVGYSQLRTEQDLLDAIKELKAEQLESQKQQTKTERKHFWAAIIVSGIAALAAIIIPLVLHFI